MKISHGARLANYSTKNGYGYATECMIRSLRNLGYEISPNDSTADVELWFDQPQHIKWGPAPYRIAYHPWESSVLKDGWVDILNTADEVWTPSGLVASWYRRQGIEKPIHIYEHGVDDIWSLRPRRLDGTMRFLHVGGEALRKGMREALEAFRKAFPGDEDVQITFKMNSPEVKVPDTKRVKWITTPVPLEEMVALYHSHHAFVYPSWGEGFGMNPLQAIATGMPTVTTSAWAPYRIYLPWKCRLHSTLVDSPWPKSHPGKMFEPNVDALVDVMRDMYNNYESYAAQSVSISESVRAYYNWDRLTKEAFESLENRLSKLPQNS